MCKIVVHCTRNIYTVIVSKHLHRLRIKSPHYPRNVFRKMSGQHSKGMPTDSKVEILGLMGVLQIYVYVLK